MTTHLVTVYDEKGEPFELGHELASQLVLNKGWSRTAPSLDDEPAPTEPEEQVHAEHCEEEQ